jgi:hypothetical protein
VEDKSMTLAAPDVMTIGQVARHFGVRDWMVRRLWERKLLPAAARLGTFRIVSSGDLPLIGQALRDAGYLDAVEDKEVVCAS